MLIQQQHNNLIIETNLFILEKAKTKKRFGCFTKKL